MTPDLKRLCEAAQAAYYGSELSVKIQDPDDVIDGMRAIVRAVLMELREVSGETEGYREGLWSRRNVEALVSDILAEPATA